MKKSELVDFIKRQLGYPTVNVEVTDEQINDSIYKAINEIKPYYTVFKYLTLDVSSQCIDLTEYQIQDVTDVMKVLDIPSGSSIQSDPFSYSGMNAYYAVPMYAISKFSTDLRNSNIHRIISSYAQMYRESFYAKLATMMQERVTGSLFENISWKFYDNKLYIDTGVPSTSIITIEYIPNVLEVEDFSDDNIYTNYLKDLSVAFTQIIQARVLGKYRINGSPTDINYQDIRSEAEREIERIRNEVINKTSNRFYITD